MNNLSIYVAGAWIHRNKLKDLMLNLDEEHGYDILSGWIGRENGVNTPKALASDAYYEVQGYD